MNFDNSSHATVNESLVARDSARTGCFGDRLTINKGNNNDNMISESVNIIDNKSDTPVASVSTNVPFETTPTTSISSSDGCDGSSIIGLQQDHAIDDSNSKPRLLQQQPQALASGERVKTPSFTRQMLTLIDPDRLGVGYTTELSHSLLMPSSSSSLNCNEESESIGYMLKVGSGDDNNDNISRAQISAKNESIVADSSETLLLNPENLERQLNPNNNTDIRYTRSTGKIVIRIDRCQSVVADDNEEDGDNDEKARLESLFDDKNNKSNNSIASSTSALDISQIEKMSTTSKLANLTSGSLSDTSFVRPSNRVEAHLARRQMEERLRNWKRSNKIITHITENPFNMHLDCLERLGHLEENVVGELDQTNVGGGGLEQRNAVVVDSGGSGVRDGDNGAKFALHNLDTEDDETSRQKKLEAEAERQLRMLQGEDKKQSSNQGKQPQQENGSDTNKQIGSQDQQVDQQPESQQHLQHLESHLSTIYKKNQAVMDSNSDFRTLLYNIICCLLIQDDQVLATPSVTKMIDVIRAHLESAAKSYATAMLSMQNAQMISKQVICSEASSLSSGRSTAMVSTSDSRKCSVTGSSNYEPESEPSGASDGPMPPASRILLSVNSIDSGNQSFIADKFSGATTTSNSSTTTSTSTPATATTTTTTTTKNNNSNHLTPETRLGSSSSRSQKSADFRRISSVSYNDEQLIHDLCDMQQPYGECELVQNGATGGSDRVPARCPDSPWRFEELWSECKHHNNNSTNHGTAGNASESNRATGSMGNLTSQSSSFFEKESSVAMTMDHMNDSGVGTMLESQTATDDNQSHNDRSSRPLTRNHRLKRHSDVSGECLFVPKQQPSYISTDDYLSQHHQKLDNKHRQYEDSQTSYYDDDTNSLLQRQDCNVVKTVDVASRRAELEWTLNKLINFELKYTWLTSQDTLRRAIRRIGVPNEIRGKVWLILIDQLIGDKYDATKILEEATKTIESDEKGELNEDEIQSILKQIELDVNRTMPGHKLFDDGAEGGVKLKRILVGYSIHINRAIAYCQGFNFIVALLLSVFDGNEEHALRGFVCIVDHIFPSKFYFDHYLTGARADQFLLADFICDQLIKSPTTAERKMVEGVTSSVTLNWFISLFHGAVPTLTRLTILDHFMLEGVKALFRFTMAILYLAFQVTPPSSCEVFTTIRNTAKDMYDIKLLLSIVEQIKLPKDSYFAIRRSFYMVQSSFNSDQFYMQSLSNDSGRQLISSKPLSLQQLPDTKPPSMSFITAASIMAHQSFGLGGGSAGDSSGAQNYQMFGHNSISGATGGLFGPRICTSTDKSKVCVQNIGKLGRSHLKIMDVNVRSNEKSLMSPLRNCLVIGVSNCGKHVILARRSSKRNFKTFQEQDLTFHVHELCTEIFDGFYFESRRIALVITHLGEVYKIDTSKCFADSLVGSTETLMLRENNSIGEHEKVKLKLASIDVLTNLLWIHVECDDTSVSNRQLQGFPSPLKDRGPSLAGRELGGSSVRSKFRENNPFLADVEEAIAQRIEAQSRSRFQRKILIIDIMTFDIFSAFSLQPNFGDIIKMRTSLLAFCQLVNPTSNSFSSRIIQIGPTGRFEQLLSFSDVVDYMIDVSDSYKRRQETQEQAQATGSGGGGGGGSNHKQFDQENRYSTIRKFLTSPMSMNLDDGSGSDRQQQRHQDYNRQQVDSGGGGLATAGTLTRYYRSLIRSHSTSTDEPPPMTNSGDNNNKKLSNIQESSGKVTQREVNNDSNHQTTKTAAAAERANQSSTQSSRVARNHPFKAVITSYLGQVEEYAHTNYVPVNMAFIFRNGKIALFEFTESYAIHTRESQLDRYDYSKVIDVKKSGGDFIITILTIYDKLIKVVI